MNIFYNRSILYFLGLVVLTFQANAMQYPSIMQDPAIQDPLIRTCESLVNQSLRAQCKFQQQLIKDSSQYIQWERLDSDVAEAKKLALPKGYTPAAILLLERARDAGHPEAEYLMGGDPQKASMPLQEYRLNRGIMEFYQLPSFPTSNGLSPLIWESKPYCLFKAILDHPKLNGSDDSSIRGQAAYALGFMCVHKLGIPNECATPETGLKYFNIALENGHPGAKEAIDLHKRCFAEQPQPAVSTTSSQIPPALKSQTMPSASAEQKLQSCKPKKLSVKVLKKPSTQATTEPVLPSCKLPDQASTTSPEKEVSQPAKQEEASTDNQAKIKEQQDQLSRQAASVKKLIETLSSTCLLPEKKEAAKPAKQAEESCKQKTDPTEKRTISTGSTPLQQPIAPRETTTTPPKLSDTAQSTNSAKAVPEKPVADKDEKAKKIQSKDLPIPAKKAKKDSEKTGGNQPTPKAAEFTIEEGACTQMNMVVPAQPLSSTAPHDLKQKHAKPDKQKKEKSKKTAQHQPAAKAPKPVDQKKESAKKDNKKKDEKKKHKEPSKSTQTASKDDQEKIECKKAYTLVTNLITHYLNASDSAILLSDICMESDNWRTAQATYKGTCKLFASKVKKENQPDELMGIFHYLQGNLKDAKQNIGKWPTTDFVTNWYRALILFATEAATPERDKTIIEIVDELWSVPISEYKNLKSLLLKNEKFDALINAISSHDDTAGVAKLTTLRLKLLFDGAQEAEAALWCAHKQGSTEASTLLAHMYTHGFFLEQSLHKALEILKTSIESDQHHNLLRVGGLREIAAVAGTKEKKDLISLINAQYLEMVEIAKSNSSDQIINLLTSSEKQFGSMDKSEQGKAADLLISSGAYQVLLPMAKLNQKIASILFEIASNRVTKYSHAKEKYDEIYKLIENAQTAEENSQGVNPQIHISPYLNSVDEYLHPVERTEIEKTLIHLECLFEQYFPNDIDILFGELDTKSKEWRTAQDAYKDAYELLQKSNLEQNQSYHELMSILLYLQGNREAAKQILHGASRSASTYWYRALALMDTEPDTPVRNKIILTYLQVAIYTPFTCYATVKNAYVLPDRLIKFLQEKSLVDIVATRVSARLGIIFGCELVGIEPETIKKALQCDDSDYEITSLICLANMYLYGLCTTQQSLSEALSIAQTIVRCVNQPVESVLDLLDEIHTVAEEQKDMIASIHADYLYIFENAKKRDVQKIIEAFQRIIKNLQSTDKPHQKEVENLLISSGAYNAVLPLAEKFEQLAAKLFECAVYHVINFKHNNEKYTEIYTIINSYGYKQHTACNMQEMPKDGEKIGKSPGEVNQVDADEQLNCLITQWNLARTILATEKETDDRNKLILKTLKQGLSIPIKMYKDVKNFLTPDKQLVSLIAEMSQTNGLATVILSRIAILFCPEETGSCCESILQNLRTLHDRGLTSASICLAQMYAFGIMVPKSLSEAIKILQTAAKFKTKPKKAIVELLNEIQKNAAEDHDGVSFIHAIYLQIVQQIKAFCVDEKYFDYIFMTLKYSEEEFNRIREDEKLRAAKLLIDSGLYEALCPIAKLYEPIALKLSEMVATRVTKYKQRNEDYQTLALTKLGTVDQHAPKADSTMQAIPTTSTGTEQSCDSIIVAHLIYHYMGKTHDTLQLVRNLTTSRDKLNPTVNIGKYAYQFFINNVERRNDFPVLMGFLNYFQISQPDPITINWYGATIQFALGDQCVAKGNKILNALQSALFRPLSEYTENVKRLLACDDQLIELLKTMAATNDLASLILARIGVIFNNNPMDSTLITFIEEGNKKRITAASIWLAEILYNKSSQQDLQKALEIVQEAAKSQESADDLIMHHLDQIKNCAIEKKDEISFIHALYLQIIQAVKKQAYYQNHKLIGEILQRSEQLFHLCSSESVRQEAAKLFKSSGAYKALLPIAAQNIDIAVALGKIISERITIYHHSEADYEDAIKISMQTVSRGIQDCQKLVATKKQ